MLELERVHWKRIVGRGERPSIGGYPCLDAVIVHDELPALKHFFLSGDVCLSRLEYNLYINICDQLPCLGQKTRRNAALCCDKSSFVCTTPMFNMAIHDELSRVS